MEKVVLPHSPMGRNKQGGYPLMRFRIWSQVDEEAMFERNQVPSRSWDLVCSFQDAVRGEIDDVNKAEQFFPILQELFILYT